VRASVDGILLSIYARSPAELDDDEDGKDDTSEPPHVLEGSDVHGSNEVGDNHQDGVAGRRNHGRGIGLGDEGKLRWLWSLGFRVWGFGQRPVR